MSDSVRQLNSSLYYAALAADDAYQEVLEQVYGRHQAADKRYQQHTDVRVLLARRAKIEADERWINEMRAHSAASRTVMRFEPGQPAKLLQFA
jgi:hypothetical protein